MITLESAYARCEEITWSEARNFAYGIRLLPPDKRRAMSALYAFARRVDDIGDGPEPPAVKLENLAGVRREVASMLDGRPPEDDAVLAALGDSTRRFPIPVAALDEVVCGCEMDCTTSRYGTYEDLSEYCRLVAGSVGRLSLGVFSSDEDPAASRLADTLGLALRSSRTSSATSSRTVT